MTPDQTPLIQTGPATVLAVLLTIVLLYIGVRSFRALMPTRRDEDRSFRIDDDAPPARPMDGHVHSFDIGIDDDITATAHRFLDERCRLCGFTQAQLDALRQFHSRLPQ